MSILQLNSIIQLQVQRNLNSDGHPNVTWTDKIHTNNKYFNTNVMNMIFHFTKGGKSDQQVMEERKRKKKKKEFFLNERTNVFIVITKYRKKRR